MAPVVPSDALIRIQMEYSEMPGLKLTPHQIGRLCGLPKDVCQEAVDLLLERGFLTRSPDGAVLRRIGVRGKG